MLLNETNDSNSIKEPLTTYHKESRIIRQKTIDTNKEFQQKQIKNPTTNINTEKKQTNKNTTKAKTKTTSKHQLLVMYKALEKSTRPENTFLEINKKNEISVYKNYNTYIFDSKEKKHNISVKIMIGIWQQFETLVTKNPNNFSLLKDNFTSWLTETTNSIKSHQIAQETFNKIINSNQNQELKPFIYKLENLLIENWQKTRKQTNGFDKKGQQIYQSWFSEFNEINSVNKIETQLNLNSYEQTFPVARSINRRFTILVGPTNSGKTHHALNELAKGENGFYLAPLRLMAAEGQEALFERGILANLITGEEQHLIPQATHTSSTVEMCNLSKIVDVAVIDEIQMIADPNRGHAWSQALIGVSAKHVVLVGSDEALPYIIPIIEQLNEPYEIKTFERKTPLHFREPIKKISDLKNNDCVIVFSRKNALAMKAEIEKSGKKCAIIYGNLSPEVRRAEAAKFKSNENPILVATDAIGMGLNLPIQRLFFSTLEKFDGIETRNLTTSEIKQIAGRSGRYGFSEQGEVGLLMNHSPSSNNLLKKAIFHGHDKPTDTRVSIAPNLAQIQTICNTIGKEDIYSALIFFKEKLIKNHKHYKTANLESMIEIASLIKHKKFNLATALNYSCVPIDINSDLHYKTFYSWVNNHLHNIQNPPPKIPQSINSTQTDSNTLYEAENYVKLCMCYRWLHYKYPEVYPKIDEITQNAKLVNKYIENTLQKNITIQRIKQPKF